MSSPVYRGGLVANIQAAAQQQAEQANAQSEAADLTASQDPDAVRLEGETGQVAGFGLTEGSAVPALNVTKVSTPAVHRGVPANLAASPLGKGGR